MTETSAVSLADVPDDTVTSHADAPQLAEQPSWREPNAPPLPALMNRRRTAEKRDQVKNIRFTPTAARLIDAAATRRGQRFASFVGDAALSAALGKPGMNGSPEDHPARPLIEAIEAHTTALDRIGRNLNQITSAIHRGTVPEQAETVLARLEQTARSSYRFIDKLLAEGADRGA